MQYIVKAEHTVQVNDYNGNSFRQVRNFYKFFENDSPAHLVSDAIHESKTLYPDADNQEVAEVAFNFERVCRVKVQKRVGEDRATVSFGKPVHFATALFNTYSTSHKDHCYFLVDDLTGEASTTWTSIGMIRNYSNHQFTGFIPDRFWQYSYTARWDMYLMGGFTLDADDDDWKRTVKLKVERALDAFMEELRRREEVAHELALKAIREKRIPFKVD